MQMFYPQLRVIRDHLCKMFSFSICPCVFGNSANSQKVFINCLNITVIHCNCYSLYEYNCHFSGICCLLSLVQESYIFMLPWAIEISPDTYQHFIVKFLINSFKIYSVSYFLTIMQHILVPQYLKYHEEKISIIWKIDVFVIIIIHDLFPVIFPLFCLVKDWYDDYRLKKVKNRSNYVIYLTWPFY